MTKQRGVTLLELLVVITLLGLVSLGLVSSLRIGSSAWRRGNARLAADRRVVAATDLLSAQLANAQARPVRWGPATSSANRAFDSSADREVRFAYFDGAPDRLRFLSTYSLEARSRGGLWLAEYFFVRKESETCDLLYNEWPFRDDRDVASTVRAAGYDITRGRQRVDFAPAARTASTRELYRGLRQCHFEYLTEPADFSPSREERQESFWAPEWETNAKFLPKAVAARFVGTEAGGIAPVGIVATLHVREIAP